jgi:diguanylate cyclase (GGDEF)-like protein
MAVGCPARADEAFTAGLLARIGRLAFVTAMPEEYDGVLARLPNLMADGIDEEKAVLGESHIEIGAELLGQWKLPALLVDSVRYQLNPAAAPTAEARQIAEAVLHAKKIADVLCGLSKGFEGNRPQQVIEISVIEDQFRQTAGMLGISLDELPDPEVIEDQARDLAEQLNVAGGLERQELVKQAKKLESQAITDGLTGLTNRKGFDARLAAEVERSRRHGRPLALLMLDLDHFKQVNDGYGHQIGDEVLKQVGRVLKETVRKCDYAARYGGEEFAVIAAESELPAAASLAERLRIAISGISISVASGSYSPTVSIGLAATSMPTETLTAETLIAQSDKLLYEAKRCGRNQCKSGLIG